MKIKVTKIGFPEIMRDNDMKYINYILRNISDIDEFAEVRFIKNPDNLRVTIITKKGLKFKLIDELKYAMYILGIEPIFSKCNKLGNTVYMDISLA